MVLATASAATVINGDAHDWNRNLELARLLACLTARLLVCFLACPPFADDGIDTSLFTVCNCALLLGLGKTNKNFHELSLMKVVGGDGRVFWILTLHGEHHMEQLVHLM